MTTQAVFSGSYRVVHWIESDMSNPDWQRWKVDTFRDHSHPDEALSLARYWQREHLEAIERQRAPVLVQLIGEVRPCQASITTSSHERSGMDSI